MSRPANIRAVVSNLPGEENRRDNDVLLDYNATIR
jgi:predicted Ser/Thr protein kinase